MTLLKKCRIALLLLSLGALLLSGCGGKKTTQSTSQEQPASQEGTEEAAQEPDELHPTHEVTITVKDYGEIKALLFGEIAPETVENFVSLSQDGFYDGLTFHRIMAGFMIQGGDPDGNGTGGSGHNIKGEFSANGVDNPIPHVRGVLSMARATPYDSASSQFFIVQADSTFLDGNYAAFGAVTEGMEVVDAICKDAKPVDNNGTILPEQQPVMESITVQEISQS